MCALSLQSSSRKVYQITSSADDETPPIPTARTKRRVQTSAVDAKNMYFLKRRLPAEIFFLQNLDVLSSITGFNYSFDRSSRTPAFFFILWYPRIIAFH